MNRWLLSGMRASAWSRDEELMQKGKGLTVLGKTACSRSEGEVFLVLVWGEFMRVALRGRKDRNGGLSRISVPWVVAGFAAVAMAYAHSVGAQGLLSKQDQECWDRHPGYVEYVKCLASVMEPIDPKRREEFGEVYGAKEYLHCALTRPPGDTYCERHRLKRRSEPEYWPHGAKPNLKLPEPPRQSVYRTGMMPKEYFDALCKAEAGEFIYKTVENVEGIYQIRPRNRVSDYELRDRNVMEDPYGYTDWEAEKPGALFVSPPFRGYLFFERPKVHPITKQWVDLRIEHHSGYVGRREGDKLIQKPMVVEEGIHLRSSYGFTWRGIKRPFDRENGIAGGELVVVDLRANEILGLRRGFIHADIKNRDYKVNWENLTVCPNLQDRPGWPKDSDFTYWFVSKVPQARKRTPIGQRCNMAQNNQTLNTIGTWLDFALQQVAAESYLHDLNFSDQDRVTERLRRGNSLLLGPDDQYRPNDGGSGECILWSLPNHRPSRQRFERFRGDTTV